MLRFLSSLAIALTAPVAVAAEPAVHSGLESDARLQELVAEAVKARPALSQARAQARAERERVSQASALPDPTLSLGLQNDGFERLQIGEMETSYYSVMLTQPLPFPGKRGLRGDVAALGAEQAETDVARAELSTVAAVERAYVDLLLARAELELLEKLEELWESSERVTKARYEVGEGSQADLLRAQLERTRLITQRASLVANERLALHTLNRLRLRPLAEPIETTARLESVRLAGTPSAELMLADAEERSPELASARLATRRAAEETRLARRELLPDFSLTAGIMPRGDVEPMWTVSLGISLPVFAGSKQLPAIDESEARRAAEAASEAELEQLLRESVESRSALLAAARRTVELYRGGLLVQSEAAVDSAVAQYQVGKVPFTAVLEAQNGYFADRLGYLGAVASALRLLIAQKEVALEPPAAGGGLATPAMALVGGGSIGGMGAPASAPASGTRAGQSSGAASAMSGM